MSNLTLIPNYTVFSYRQKQLLDELFYRHMVCHIEVFASLDREYYAIRLSVLPEDVEIGLTLAEFVPICDIMNRAFKKIFESKGIEYSIRIADLNNKSPLDNMTRDQMDMLATIINGGTYARY